MGKYFCIFFFISIWLPSYCQQHHVFKAAFWNLENLFDTINNPLVIDDDFTPSGYKQWTKSRLNQKVDKLSRAIIAMGEWEHVALLGICEVENDTVLRKLIYHSPLKSEGYQYIHHESNDIRGIDVAVIYQKDIFTPFHSELLDVDISTRGILYISGLIGSDTLHVFINHWPSRRGGFYGSESRRIKAAETLRRKVDSLQINKEVKILIMGDFNDDPDDKSLANILNAKPYYENTISNLLNLTYGYLYKDIGTLKFQGKWNIFDNIIVSRELITGTGKLKVIPHSCRVFYIEQMVKYGKTGLRPNPTYLGPYYNGGFSDHLPVVVDFHY